MPDAANPFAPRRLSHPVPCAICGVATARVLGSVGDRLARQGVRFAPTPQQQAKYRIPADNRHCGCCNWCIVKDRPKAPGTLALLARWGTTFLGLHDEWVRRHKPAVPGIEITLFFLVGDEIFTDYFNQRIV